jgi:rhamnosyltransferase
VIRDLRYNAPSPVIGGDAALGSGRNAGEDVAAIVVSFEPDEGFRARLEAMVPQVGITLVIDNSVNETAQARVAKLCADLECGCVINRSNLGVAEALNQGIELAGAAGVQYVVTMDQDSMPNATMVRELYRVMVAGARSGVSIGIVAPTTFDKYQTPQPLPANVSPWSEISLAITSGAMISMEVFRSLGLFRSEFFIDGIDQEFCLRLRQHGRRIVRAHAAVLQHRLGSPTIHRMLGMRFIPTNHSPDRRFFIARNTVWIARLFVFAETDIVVSLIWKLFKNALLIAVFEDDKIQKLWATARGVAQGIRTRPPAISPLQVMGI